MEPTAACRQYIRRKKARPSRKPRRERYVSEHRVMRRVGAISCATRRLTPRAPARGKARRSARRPGYRSGREHGRSTLHTTASARSVPAGHRRKPQCPQPRYPAGVLFDEKRPRFRARIRGAPRACFGQVGDLCPRQVSMESGRATRNSLPISRTAVNGSMAIALADSCRALPSRRGAGLRRRERDARVAGQRNRSTVASLTREPSAHDGRIDVQAVVQFRGRAD